MGLAVYQTPRITQRQELSRNWESAVVPESAREPTDTLANTIKNQTIQSSDKALAGKRSSPQEPGELGGGIIGTTEGEAIKEPKTGHRTLPTLLLLPTSPGVITEQFESLS
ncbi:hypothetical protein DSO57_1028563 [Entomophthora muscae]|uniref:Uncharacterized protein n=1 Tax=Entomophthora muscae TaxID=34485 RepID=A0ACC2RG84_9FUNG|nr:hypothetical protein DSO57_1028563 [Entomophthora muscae]